MLGSRSPVLIQLNALVPVARILRMQSSYRLCLTKDGRKLIEPRVLPECGLRAYRVRKCGGNSLADKYMLEACCGDFHLDSRDIASNEKRSNPALQPFQAWGVAKVHANPVRRSERFTNFSGLWFDWLLTESSPPVELRNIKLAKIRVGQRELVRCITLGYAQIMCTDSFDAIILPKGFFSTVTRYTRFSLIFSRFLTMIGLCVLLIE